MGRRGPPKKPQEMQAKRGFPGKRVGARDVGANANLQSQHLGQDSPSVPVAEKPQIPAPPGYLRKAARAIWAELWTSAAGESIARLRDTDGGIVARYCVLRSQLEAMLGKGYAPTYATTSTTGARVIKSNPAWAAMLQLQQQVTALENLLGLNPRSRIDLLQRYADHRDPMKPTGALGAVSHQGDSDAHPRAMVSDKPATPLNLLRSTYRGPSDAH